jgi:hypothetical protein
MNAAGTRSEGIRPCQICGYGANLHADPLADDHAYDPKDPTPDEAAQVVAWLLYATNESTARQAAHEFAATGRYTDADVAAIKAAADPATSKWSDAN